MKFKNKTICESKNWDGSPCLLRAEGTIWCDGAPIVRLCEKHATQFAVFLESRVEHTNEKMKDGKRVRR